MATRTLKVLAILTTSVLAQTGAGQPTAPVVEPQIEFRAEPFPLSAVRLTDSVYKRNQDIAVEYLLSVDADRLLSWFRKEAGLEPKGEVYAGWESGTIAGHSLGHYLSGLSLGYASTGDDRLRDRARYVVDEIIACQEAGGDGYASAIPNGRAIFEQVSRGEIRSGGFDLNGSWVPWYTQHKVLAGLRDAYRLTGYEPARDSLLNMADWVVETVSPLTEEQIQRMLACEHGGMNEVMADVYAMTGDQKYLDVAAHAFYHKAVLDPLAKGADPLRGIHANTQIPKVIGQARICEVSGDADAGRLARHFWDLVTDRYTYANGGNSTWEMFSPPNVEAGALPETTETCNTYNMLRLTDHLFRWTADPRYMDYFERALLNHILAQQHPDGGRYMYRAYLDPGAHKTWSGRYDTWTCCHGTGMENHVRHNEAIYYHGAGPGSPTLFVNLYIPSTLDWAEQGLSLTQESELPFGDAVSLELALDEPTRLAIKLRRPHWASTAMVVRINGKPVQVDAYPGEYANISRVWQSGDRIDIQLPMAFRQEPAPDDSTFTTFHYGPTLLAAMVPEHGPVPVLVGSPASIMRQLEPVPGKPLEFRAAGVARSIDPERMLADPDGALDLQLKPLFAIVGERYNVYNRVLSPIEWQDESARLAEEIAALAERNARTTDLIRMGEMQPERDHDLRGENTRTGEHYGRRWRDAFDGGWFEFDMEVDPDAPMTLLCTYWGGDGPGRDFDVLIDGEAIVFESLQAEAPGVFFDRAYPIPAALTRGKKQVTVRLDARDGLIAGGLFGECRMLRASD